ncbi:hypothetical protein [Streptomyces sp. NPDC048521]
MATGILSVGLHLAGDETASRVALAMTGVAWPPTSSCDCSANGSDG